MDNQAYELEESSSSTTNPSPNITRTQSKSNAGRVAIVILSVFVTLCVASLVAMVAFHLQASEQLRKELDKVTSENVKLTIEVNQAKEKIAQLEKDNSALTNQNADLTNQLQSEKKINTELQNEIRDLTTCAATDSSITLKAMPERTSKIPVPVVQRYVATDGDWIVFQRRKDGSVDFARNWTEYVEGFGTPCGEYWLGLEKLYQLTKNGDQKLRIDMIQNDTRVHYYAEYSSFKMSSSADNYRLSVSGYAGNATDAMIRSGNGDHHASNGNPFSTIDADHDRAPGNCALQGGGGWWYRSCSAVRLNGRYDGKGLYGILWMIYPSNKALMMTFVEMKMKERG